MAAEQFLHGIDTIEVNDAARPIRTLKSSVIGVLGTAGQGPVNVPTLIIGNKREAVTVFGVVRDDGFTIPQALDAIFDQGGATVVVINVAKPDQIIGEDSFTEQVSLALNDASVSRGYIRDVDIDNLTTGASKVFTGTANLVANDSITVGTQTYVLKAAPAAEDEVKLGPDLATTLANLVLAINGGPGKGDVYHADTNNNDLAIAKSDATTLTVTSKLAGTQGNAIDIAETGTHGSWAGGAVKLSGGAIGDGIVADYVVSQPGTITLPTGATLIHVKNSISGNVLSEDDIDDLTIGTKVRLLYIANLVEGIDYTVDRALGIIQRVTTGGSKLLPGSRFSITYNALDPSLVELAELVGQVEEDGSLTGVQAFLNAKSTLAVQPRILCAPGHVHTRPDAVTPNPLAIELAQLAVRLSAMLILDTPNTTKEAAVSYRQDFGSERVYCHYPFYKVYIPFGHGSYIEQPASARIAGLISAVDNSEGFWNSPSNREILGVLGLSKPIDFALNQTATVANYLNENYVATTIQEQGTRLWGNRTASGKFLSVRRTSDMVNESILFAHLWAVDKNITKGYVEAVVEGVNQYLRRLTSLGAILGGKAWADPSLNTPASIADGQLFIDYDFTAPTPAEHITFRAHLVNDYITEIFQVTSTAVAPIV